jgi:hypothetical protein
VIVERHRAGKPLYMGPTYSIAEFLRPRLKDGDTIFTAHHLLLYWVLDKSPLVPIAAFPSNAFRERQIVKPLLGEESRQALEETAELLASLGHTIVRRDPDWGSNGKIAFTRSLVGAFVWEIFTMSANGTGVTRLTSVHGPDFDPSWSRDAERIAFASGRDGGANLELYVMAANGSGQTRLTVHSAVDRAPDW